jgi:hypothetical protein
MDLSPRSLLPDITDAVEQALQVAPAFGPGWSVGFVDAIGKEFAQFTLANFSQANELEAIVGRLGFKLVIDAQSGFDYVFAPQTTDTIR